ncbi:MAG: restriction endonuclease subunit S [Lachnospiraceae bacterium]|nr:restriction endonuclease subunit S [Lachnospiraceae bacterium]
MPNSWQTVKLQDIAKINYGKDHKKLSDGNIPVYGTGGIMRYVDTPLYEKKSVLIPRKGSLGNLFFVNEPFWTVDTLFYTEIDESKVIPEFLYYKLMTYDLASMNVGSAVPSLTTAILNPIEVELPPLDIQQEIVKTLGILDEKIENNQKINHHLEQMAKNIFNEYFIDLTPFNGQVPSNWKVSNLAGIANYLNGLAMQRHRPAEGEIGLPVMKIKELRQGFTDSSSDLCSPNIRSDFIIQNGTVIFSWSGTLLVDFWTGGNCGLNQHLFKVTSEDYDKWFYYSWTKHHLDRFVQMAADKATTMGHIKRDALEQAEVLIPNYDDYKNIGSLLEPIYDQIINNRLESGKLVSLRDSLLPKLISGKITVTD